MLLVLQFSLFTPFMSTVDAPIDLVDSVSEADEGDDDEAKFVGFKDKPFCLHPRLSSSSSSCSSSSRSSVSTFAPSPGAEVDSPSTCSFQDAFLSE